MGLGAMIDTKNRTKSRFPLTDEARTKPEANSQKRQRRRPPGTLHRALGGPGPGIWSPSTSPVQHVNERPNGRSNVHYNSRPGSDGTVQSQAKNVATIAKHRLSVPRDRIPSEHSFSSITPTDPEEWGCLCMHVAPPPDGLVMPITNTETNRVYLTGVDRRTGGCDRRVIDSSLRAQHPVAAGAKLCVDARGRVLVQRLDDFTLQHTHPSPTSSPPLNTFFSPTQASGRQARPTRVRAKPELLSSDRPDSITPTSSHHTLPSHLVALRSETLRSLVHGAHSLAGLQKVFGAVFHLSFVGIKL
ncbi:hypothetical protein HD554DRAFT_1103417 [Boletus coccyginus]|nr:hypothetical protein HD554DRAFT_1103417 [Boletus coccyginus]